MATNPKKNKAAKDNERKNSKRTEESTPVEEKKEEIVTETPVNLTEESESEVKEELTPKPPTPEPVYEEPVLTQLIVESYEGEKEKGLYEGYGEAVYKGGHTYKGQFFGGMMHGRGVYVWNDGVSYEGEFCQNKVTGKGTYRWVNGSTYEGDVVDGVRHGVGTFRCSKDKLSYTGDWTTGKRHGKGRMEFDADGVSFYEGDWVLNNKHGWGTRSYRSGNIYQGMWFNNVCHGEGTMRWLDRDQMYTGQWERGIQHGLGQHIWFLRRKSGSQYPLRNLYDGEFVRGMRHGYGTFFYANGARYEGDWQNNMKHGKGRFVFKNGRIYEGVFDKDHIVEFPNFEMDGVNTPDLSQIRTRTPLPSENMSVASNVSRNTYSPSFQLDVEHLLLELPEADREEEASQVMFVMMRHMTSLRKVYTFYSGIGFEESPDNTFVMSRMQFWRMLKDCQFHHRDITLMDMDRLLQTDAERKEDMHNPYSKILFREFTNHLVSLAYHLFNEDHESTEPVLAWCLSQLITEHILPHSCSVKGYVYNETRRAVNALVHIDQAYEVYKAFSQPRKSNPQEYTMKMRQFLFMMKDLRMVNSDLTPKAVVEILAIDDPKVTDEGGAINLELEMTFLEFLEALVGCAQVFVTETVVKDPTTPRPSTTLTQGEHSLPLSIPGSPSRGPSQLDEGGDDGTLGLSSPQEGEKDTEIEASSPPPRSASHVSSKTTDVSIRHGEGSERGTFIQPHPDSARKSATDIGVDGKKSASFISSHSGVTEGGPTFVQSVVSIGQAQSELGLEHRTEGDDDDEVEGDYYEEDIDEATRQFNFWTHQVHIFFVRKFFPAAQKLMLLTRLVQGGTS